jgi:hypothetical protein
MKHEHRVLKARAAGMAKATFSRKAGAHDGPSKRELVEAAVRADAKDEIGLGLSISDRFEKTYMVLGHRCKIKASYVFCGTRRYRLSCGGGCCTGANIFDAEMTEKDLDELQTYTPSLHPH